MCIGRLQLFDTKAKGKQGAARECPRRADEVGVGCRKSLPALVRIRKAEASVYASASTASVAMRKTAGWARKVTYPLPQVKIKRVFLKVH